MMNEEAVVQVVDPAKTAAVTAGFCQHEMYIDKIVANPVHCAESDPREERYASFDRVETEWTDPAITGDKEPEECDTSGTLTPKEAFHAEPSAGM